MSKQLQTNGAALQAIFCSDQFDLMGKLFGEASGATSHFHAHIFIIHVDARWNHFRGDPMEIWTQRTNA